MSYCPKPRAGQEPENKSMRRGLQKITNVVVPSKAAQHERRKGGSHQKVKRRIVRKPQTEGGKRRFPKGGSDGSTRR